jgi:hypothetical protein
VVVVGGTVVVAATKEDENICLFVCLTKPKLKKTMQ